MTNEDYYKPLNQQKRLSEEEITELYNQKNGGVHPFKN